MSSTSRSAKLAKWLSVPLGLVISALLIWQASYAAFSSTVTRPDNTWSTGSVTLTHADDGTPLFEEAKLVPGDSASKDVTVTYGGDLAAIVKFYGANASAGALAEYIDLEIRGSWGESYDETANGQIWRGSLATLAAGPNSYGNGVALDVPADMSGKTGTFRFTYTVTEPPAGVDVAGATTEIDFVLEARSR